MKFAIIVSILLGSCGLCVSQTVENSSPLITTPLGTIEGYYDTSYGGRQFEAYEGIPFAEPPIGDLRFEVPKGITPWTGVLKAKQFGAPCLQYIFFRRNSTNTVAGSEDCLYLNVYTPLRDRSGSTLDLLPVIFFISGGAFYSGAGSLYEPDYLLDRDVTLVTINYRLGPLGFLNTEDEIVPGNMGLKDQVMALRWVNDNIQSFGGDPSRITIVGHSSGGASVQYHYLTDLTRGLFQNGISLSGTALGSYAYVENPRDKAKQLAGIVGCPTDNNQEMVDCLKATPGDQIVNAVSQFSVGGLALPNGWAPSKERGSGEFTFIDRSPEEIIASGDIQDLPWITGVVSEEGLFPTATYLANKEAFKSLNDNWEAIAPYLLYFIDTVPESNRSKVATSIKQYFFGGSAISEATFNQTVRMISDRWFFYPFEKAARAQSEFNESPVYVFYFSYRGAHSVTDRLTGTNANLGVCHADDLLYVLKGFFDPTTTAKDREMQQVLIDLWVSFATNGTPDLGVHWPRLKQKATEKLRYLHISGPGKIRIHNASSRFGDKDFWNSINLA